MSNGNGFRLNIFKRADIYVHSTNTTPCGVYRVCENSYEINWKSLSESVHVRVCSDDSTWNKKSIIAIQYCETKQTK